MKITLYHGSVDILENPEYGKGASANDYGRGFYCTENIELAKEWACAKNTDGYANCYELDLKNLKLLNLNEQPYILLNWLALLTKYRTYWEKNTVSAQAQKYLADNFLIDISDFDVIVGYRADDSYFTFAQDFVANSISYTQLNTAMRLGKLGLQYVLKSPKAFENISFKGATIADSEEYFYKKNNRDMQARQNYRNTKKDYDVLNDIYMLDIMREGMKQNDPRLR